MGYDWPKRQTEVVREEPLVIKNEKFWAHFHSYGGWGRFFAALQKEKLMATRCANPDCGEKRLWLPPRCECPDCWHATEWVEAPLVATVYTWSIIKYPGELFRLPADTPLVSLEIKGVGTKLMSWLKEGTPKIGMKVKAVFNTERPTHTILDLAWVPA